MNALRNFTIGALIGAFLLLGAGPVSGQQTTGSHAENDQGKSSGGAESVVLEGFKEIPDSLEKLIDFTDSGSLTEHLEDRIPPEKLKKIEAALKNGKFSKEQIHAVLKRLGLSRDEFETATIFFDNHFKLLKKTSHSIPIILSMNQLEKKIRIKEKERDMAQPGEEKKKITRELEALDEQLSKLEYEFEKYTVGIGEVDLLQLPIILKRVGSEGDEARIISSYIRDQVEFVKNVETVRSIIQSMDQITKSIAGKQDALSAAVTEEAKETLTEETNKLGLRLKSLEHNLTIVTTGIDTDALYKKEEKEVDWNNELKLVFSPIFSELREITNQPRRMEKLRSEINHYEKRIPQITQGVEYIAKFKKNVRDANIRTRLEKSEAYWRQQGKEMTTGLDTARHQLFKLEKQKGSMLERINFIFESFIKQRGKNVLLVVVAFILTFFLLYLFRKVIMLINPFRYIIRYRYIAYLVDTFLYVLTFVIAILAVVFVLYIRGDWLILGVIIIILAGVGWAMKNMLPQFIEQIKLIMNIGPVRLAERVIYNGIAWKVESIGIYCRLRNPLLTGGTLRLPLNDLIGMRSRPAKKNEPWFPCAEGDYVLINNKDRRQVLVQTPEVMEFSWYDMRETMPTSAFLNEKIFNLSAAPYWSGIMFYLAARHRLDALKIGKILEKRTDEEMKQFGAQYLETWAEFCELTEDSALGFMVWVRMDKDAGALYSRVKMTITQTALTAANENNWDIVRFSHIQLYKGNK
ncbi:MAG: hypothetical protein GY859_03540 [Desulfobacterales bacterium]|nr:hypothetical protein [Desulfobacterales bacterium]